jgi:hypothetical protein
MYFDLSKTFLSKILRIKHGIYKKDILTYVNNFWFRFLTYIIYFQVKHCDLSDANKTEICNSANMTPYNRDFVFK